MYHFYDVRVLYFYFVIVILVVVDIVQSRYQKKLIAIKKSEDSEQNQDDAA